LPSASGPAPAGAVPPPQAGLAIASLILGLLSLVCAGPLTGLPAIITGHLALSRVRRAPAQYGGKGLAVAGLALGYFSFLFTLLVIALVISLRTQARFSPARNQPGGSAPSIQCVNHLKQIGLAARLYANDHADYFPKDFLTMSNELASPKILWCPADSSKTRAETWAALSPANISYEFLVPGAKEGDVVRAPAFRCPIHRHVCFGDGSVERGDQRKPR
jgi:hypothetical protein